MRMVLEGWDRRVAIGGKRISNLRYDDDTVIMGTSMEELQTIMESLEQGCTDL